jgi:hypothetical protein
MAKKKKPTARCPACQKVVARSSMGVHYGKRPCVEAYWAAKFLRDHAMPSGYSVVHSASAEMTAYEIVNRAGVSVEESPVLHRLVAWPKHDGSKPEWPVVVVIAPTWLGHVATTIGHLRDDINSHRTYAKRLAAGQRMPAFIRKHMEAEDADALAELMEDMLDRASVVLKYASADAQLGMSVRFELESAGTMDQSAWRELVLKVLIEEAQHAAEAM